MSRLRPFLAAAAVALATLGLGACGDSADPVAKQPDPTPRSESVGSGTPASLSTTPRTCAQLRTAQVDYDELYDQLACRLERRRLCRGLTSSSARYGDYQCVALKRAANRRAQARKKAAAKKRALADKKATVKQQAASKRSERTSSGSAGSSTSKAKSSSSSGSSSSGSSGSSGSSSSGSSGSRRR